MSRSPVLFMRRKSLISPFIGRHSGVSGLNMPLSRSVGGFIGLGADLVLEALAGWTGLENCYDPVFANFNGTNNYLTSPAFTADNHADEGTIAIWFTPVDG